MSKTGQNIVPFDSFKPGRGDRESIELQLNAALVKSENIFGSYSGEVGLVLLAMVDHYKDDLSKGELVSEFQRRIDDIVAMYLMDQEKQ